MWSATPMANDVTELRLSAQAAVSRHYSLHSIELTSVTPSRQREMWSYPPHDLASHRFSCDDGQDSLGGPGRSPCVGQLSIVPR